jgi:hypothetical protein
MVKEAAEAGFYKSPHLDDNFPRIQILTVEQLLRGEEMKYPRWVDATFKKAPRAREKEAVNILLPLGDNSGPDEAPADDETEEPF